MDAARACVEHAVRKLIALGYSASDIQAIGITNQRETTLVWDRLTGEPLYPAIIWSDGRTADTVQKLASSTDKGLHALQSICGLPLATYFSAVKLRWLLDHVPAVAEAREQGRLQFGTLDTWLIYVRFEKEKHSTLVMETNTLAFSHRISQVVWMAMESLLQT